MLAAGLLARNARREGPAAPSRGSRRRSRPGSKVVTDYLERGRRAGRPRRARLQPRRLRLHDLHRQLRPAARRRSPPRSTTPTSSVGSRAVRQPQLRGPHQPRREDELPRVAAARRRLRARGHDGHRPRQRPDRPDAEGRGRSTCATSGRRAQRDRGDDRVRACSRTCSATQLRRGLRRRRALERARRADRRPLRVGRRLDLRAAARRTSTACRASPSPSPTSRARACWRSSATRSRPTTSRRRARSSADGPGGDVPRGARRHAARVQLATARGAATTR